MLYLNRRKGNVGIEQKSRFSYIFKYIGSKDDNNMVR
ncbi:hypothetical protein LBJG_01201 [Lactobacillus jensenii 1153]|nr:hypothetical protein LBJG_01201 [Lactobacillus jensenii 1153]